MPCCQTLLYIHRCMSQGHACNKQHHTQSMRYTEQTLAYLVSTVRLVCLIKHRNRTVYRTWVLLLKVPATLTMPSCSVSWEFMLIMCALLVHSRVVMRRVCTSSLASTLADAMSLRLAASLICFWATFSRRVLSRICRSKSR